MVDQYSWVLPNAEERRKLGVHPAPEIDDGRTKQAMAADSDINTIMANYGKTGMFAHLSPREPHYGDFSKATDLLEALTMVKEAEADFMELPAAVRALADNNPVQLLEMLADEGATKALIEAGLPVNTGPIDRNPVDETAETK